MHCPDCRKPLVRTRHPGDVQWACVACRRRLVADATLEVLLTDEAAAAFVAARLGVERLGPRPCPSCRHRMAARTIELPQATTGEGALTGEGVAVVRASPIRPERVLVRPDGKLAPPDEEFAKPLTLFTPIVICAMYVSIFGLSWSGGRLWRRHDPEHRLPLSTWSWPADSSWWAQLLDVPAMLVHSGFLASLLASLAFGIASLALERRVGGLRTLSLCLLANGIGRVGAMPPTSSSPALRTVPPTDRPRGLASVPLIALLPAWLALDLTLGRIPLPLRRDIVFQPTSAMQYVGGLLVGLLFGGWWCGFTLRHPGSMRRGTER